MDKYFILIGCNIYDFEYREVHPEWRKEFIYIKRLSSNVQILEQEITELILKCSFHAVQGCKHVEAAFLLETCNDVKSVFCRNNWWPYDHVNNSNGIDRILSVWFHGDPFINLTDVYEEAADKVGCRPSLMDMQREFSIAIRLTSILTHIGFGRERAKSNILARDLVSTAINDIKYGNGNFDEYVNTNLNRYSAFCNRYACRHSIGFLGVSGQGCSRALRLVDGISRMSGSADISGVRINV